MPHVNYSSATMILLHNEDFQGVALVMISLYPVTSCAQHNFICHSFIISTIIFIIRVMMNEVKMSWYTKWQWSQKVEQGQYQRGPYPSVRSPGKLIKGERKSEPDEVNILLGKEEVELWAVTNMTLVRWKAVSQHMSKVIELSVWYFQTRSDRRMNKCDIKWGVSRTKWWKLEKAALIKYMTRFVSMRENEPCMKFSDLS